MYLTISKKQAKKLFDFYYLTKWKYIYKNITKFVCRHLI